MKSLIRWHAVLFLVLTVMTAGCATFPGQSDSVIGTLRASGPNVWLNGAAGRDGMAVRLGDTLATGPGSSAMVDFQGGGFLQLDENTDPLFSWIEQTKCILTRIMRGQAYLKKEKACVEGPNINLVLNSEANIRIGAELTELTLIRGSATVWRPERVRVETAQQVTVAGQRISAVRAVSTEALAAITAWRETYSFKPPAKRSGELLRSLRDSTSLTNQLPPTDEIKNPTPNQRPLQ
ncbi:MAG TPA: hypothetical protein VI298_15080 [Geobacteraceae bacterium]